MQIRSWARGAHGRSRRYPLAGTAIAVLAVAAATLSGCGKSTDTGTGTGTSIGASAAASTGTGAVPAKADPAQWCAFQKDIFTKYGFLSNGKLVPPDQATKDKYLALLKEFVGSKDKYLALAPQELKADLTLELQGLQAMIEKNSNTADTLPAGWDAAEQRLNTYRKDHCGLDLS